MTVSNKFPGIREHSRYEHQPICWHGTVAPYASQIVSPSLDRRPNFAATFTVQLSPHASSKTSEAQSEIT